MITGAVPTRNWAGNVVFAAARVHEPTAVDQLQGIVARARHVKALGTGHSFSRVADTVGELISTARLPRTIDVDAAARTVRVAGGVRFAELAVELERHGAALPNTGSLPHITVVGALATGTHGSGDANGVIARQLRSMQIVTESGAVRTVDGRELEAAAVGLGATGIVVEATLATVETFTLQQHVYTGLSRRQLVAHLDEIMAAAYSVSVFTTWTASSRICVKSSVGSPAPHSWLGADLADRPIPVIDGGDVEAATTQLGVPGPWHERLPHFRADFVPSVGFELQSEFFVPRAAGAAAVDAIFRLRDVLAPVLLGSELRTVAADDLWLSPAGGSDVLAIHFTWAPDEVRVRRALVEVERALAEFGARPHWGKIFTIGPAVLADRYPRLSDFAEYLQTCDPRGVFRNPYLDWCLGVADS